MKIKISRKLMVFISLQKRSIFNTKKLFRKKTNFIRRHKNYFENTNYTSKEKNRVRNVR